MNLLLLTKLYPYGTGEAFIENEIRTLSSCFEKIVIVACEVPIGEKRIRALPENVCSYAIPGGAKWKDLLSGVRYIVSSNPILKEEYRHCKTPFQRLFLGYFEAKSHRIFRNIPPLGELDGESFVLYSYWLFTTARVGMLIAQNRKPRYRISRAHGYDLYTYRNRLRYLPYREAFLKEYDMVLPCSENGTDFLNQNTPGFSEKIKTAYLGTTDHGLGKPGKPGCFVIVTCSRVSPEKRLERVADALDKLEKPALDVEWIHIGGGKDLEKLKAYAARKQKHFTVKCLGDIPNAEVMRFYRENGVDLFLNVSSSEGLPVSIMEAMSFGIPVVATDVGGTSEIVMNGHTGRLLPHDFSDRQLTDAIEDFVDMKSRERYSQYRESCRRVWKEQFHASDVYRACWKNIQDRWSAE